MGLIRHNMGDGNQSIPLQAFRLRPISKEGLNNVTPELRNKWSKTTFKPLRGVDVPHSVVNTKDKLAELVRNVWGFGVFQIDGYYCHPFKRSKSPQHIKLAKVIIREHDGEDSDYRAIVTDLSYLRRQHWFLD